MGGGASKEPRHLTDHQKEEREEARRHAQWVQEQQLYARLQAQHDEHNRRSANRRTEERRRVEERRRADERQRAEAEERRRAEAEKKRRANPPNPDPKAERSDGERAFPVLVR